MYLLETFFNIKEEGISFKDTPPSLLLTTYIFNLNIHLVTIVYIHFPFYPL